MPVPEIGHASRRPRTRDSISARRSVPSARRIAARVGGVWLIVLLLIGGVTGVPAQVLPVAGSTEIYDLIPARDRAVIESERAATRQQEITADGDLTQARVALEQERGLVEIKKKEIDVIKARVDQAKKTKDAAQQADLEGQKKAQEIEQTLLERRVEMRERERDFVEARKKAAQGDGAALDRELDLAIQREQLAALRAEPGGATAEQLAQQESKVRDAQRAVLNAEREAAARRGEAEQKGASLIESRIKVLEAQFAALAVRG